LNVKSDRTYYNHWSLKVKSYSKNATQKTGVCPWVQISKLNVCYEAVKVKFTPEQSMKIQEEGKILPIHFNFGYLWGG